MPLSAIIFDVDGTLAETEEAHRHAFNRAFAAAGLDWHWTEDDYRELLTTTGGRERIARFRAEAGLSPDPALVAALHTQKNRLYAETLAAGGVRARPGIERLIRESRERGIALAIATTTSRSNLDALLTCLFGPQSRGWFAAIAVGEDVRAKKPDPEVYQLVLRQLALDPGQCVAIEDSVNGLEAALACGIATVVTRSVYTGHQDFSGAALVCDALDTGSTARPVTVDRMKSLLDQGGRPWRGGRKAS